MLGLIDQVVARELEQKNARIEVFKSTLLFACRSEQQRKLAISQSCASFKRAQKDYRLKL